MTTEDPNGPDPTPPANSGEGQFTISVDEVRVGTPFEPDVTVEPDESSDLGEIDINHSTRKWLAAAMAASTVIVGLCYVLIPLWAGNEKWARAEPAFQVVFTALVGFTGSAITFYFTGRDKQ